MYFNLKYSGAELDVDENAPRPEEERITQQEKNKRMKEQLDVSTLLMLSWQMLPINNLCVTIIGYKVQSFCLQKVSCVSSGYGQRSS